MLPAIIWLKCSYFHIKTPICTSRFMTQDLVKLFPVLFWSLFVDILLFCQCRFFNDFQFVCLFHICFSLSIRAQQIMKLTIPNTSRLLSQSQVIFWISTKEKRFRINICHLLYIYMYVQSVIQYVTVNCLWTQKAAMLDTQTNWGWS